MNCQDVFGQICAHVNPLPSFLVPAQGGAYACPRLIIGCAGVNISNMTDLCQAATQGAWCVDVADIYPGAEALASSARSRIVHTKIVPDANQLTELSPDKIQQALLRSKSRLGRVPHCMQLHWWGEPGEDLARTTNIESMHGPAFPCSR